MNKKLSTRTASLISLAVVAVVLVIAGIVSEKFFHSRIDLTENKQFTLSKAAIKTLDGLTDIVTIKAVISKDLPTQFAQIRTTVKDLLEEFAARSNGKIHLIFEDPGKDESKKSSVTSLGIQEVQLQEATTDGMEIKKGFFGLAITYLDKKEVIPVLSDIESFEYDLVVKLKKLTGTTKSIGIIEGSGDQKYSFTIPGQPPRTTSGFDDNYSQLKKEVEKLYKIENVDVSSKAVDTNIDLLVVAAPKRLDEIEKFHIDQYIMLGKSVLFLSPGVEVNLSYGINGSATSNNYEDLLSHYGLGVKKNIIVDRVNPMPVHFGNGFFPIPYPYWIRCMGEDLDMTNVITSRLGVVTFPWASSIELDSNKSTDSSRVQVLVRSSADSWEETGTFNLLPRNLNEYLPVGQKSFPLAVLKSGKFSSFYDKNPIPSDSSNAIDPLNVLRKGEKESHIMVLGNALFATDFYLGFTGSNTNLWLLLNSIDQLALDPELITIRTREIPQRPIEPDKEKQKLSLMMINMLAAPILLLLVGIFMGIRRKRRDD